MYNLSVGYLRELAGGYYDSGIRALNGGDPDRAIKYLYSAAEGYLLLAKELKGEKRERVITKAEDIVAFAESIEERIYRIDRAEADNNERKEDEPNLQPQSQEGRMITLATEAQKITFDQVVGLDEVKEEIRRLAIYPRQHPQIYEMFKKKKSAGILLYGVPGTGKTMIANAIASELGASFFQVKCSDILSKWFGEAEQNIRSLFEEAAGHPISVIFLDEFDALGTKRDTDSSTMKRLIPELLMAIQRAEESENTLIVIAATNRPWDIDSAFLRPGRFNIAIHIPLPDEAARGAMINSLISNIPCAEGLDIDKLVALTDGFSGADIVNLCERMKDRAIERIINDGGCELITDSDLEYAIGHTASSVRAEDLADIQRYKEGRM